MEKEILFSEKQRFTQWWLWIILLGVNASFFWGAYQQLILNIPFGDKPMSDVGVIITLVLVVGSFLLFLFFRLETTIKKEGVYVRFFPIHFKPKFFAWENISKSYVREYSPIMEYGGWGLRMGWFGKGKAYSVSGNKGLQLEFSNEKKLLIGTNCSEQLTEALIKINCLRQ